jgi:hypothetical protein
MRCPEFMQVQGPSTRVIPEVANGRWLVRKLFETSFVSEPLSHTGVLSDATKSVSRAYINNFQDKAKQQAIDLFLVGVDRH